MKGALGEGVVPQLLRVIYVGRRTGSLHLSHADEQHSLRFHRGHIVNARTSVVGERLGEVMRRRGLISSEDLARATETVLGTRKRLGQVLIEMGVIDASALEDAVAVHVHEMLARVFAWTLGSYAFEEEPESGDELTLKLSTGELILEAVQAVRDPQVVRDALGDLEAMLAPSGDPLLRFQKLRLSPTQGFVLSRVDGATSIREIVQMIPLPAEDVERSLFGLLSTGIVELTSTRRRSVPDTRGEARPASPPPETTPVTPQAPPPPTSIPTARAAAAAPAAGTPAAAAGGTPALGVPAAAASANRTDDPAARRREILEAAQGLRERDHFQVLGLARTAREPEVKEAYFRLAKRFHPDVHHDESLADLRDQLEAVFIRLGDAYEVLRDPARRSEYEDRLGRARPALGKAAPPDGTPGAGPGGAPANAPQRPAVKPAENTGPDAELALQRAGKHFDQEHYWDAIQLLEPIAEKVHGLLRARVKVLLARCYLKNPKWSRRAEETLLSVTRGDTPSPDAWSLLGGIYAAKGMPNRAVSMYRKVLELRSDEEAAAYVSAHEPGADAAGTDDPPGLLRRLFRKP